MSPDPFLEEVATRFTAAIAAARISKSQAARDLNVSRQMLYEYLKGKSLPRHAVLQRACSAWGLKLDYKGILVTAESFPKSTVNEPSVGPEQLKLDLQQALDRLKDEDLDIRIVRKGNGRVELQVNVKFGT